MDLQICIKASSPQLFADNVGSYGIRCLFVLSTRQRRDIDNMTKLVMDACSGLIWEDDTQVNEAIAQKRIDRDFPHTEIVVYQTTGADVWTRCCELCAKEFKVYPSWGNRRFCSRGCSALAHTTDSDITCAQCGIVIHRPPSRTRSGSKTFCSMTCKAAFGHVTVTCTNCGSAFQRPRSSPARELPACSIACRVTLEKQRDYRQIRGTCPMCGGPKSKRKYQGCQACRLANKGRQPRNRTTAHLVRRRD